ncbi:MAG: transcription termination factor NusA [Alphaproteobacteria bacterium]
MASKKIKPSDQGPAAHQPFHELLVVADTVAREKSIDREEVIGAMEQAIQKATRAKYGFEHDVRVSISRSSGEVSVYKCLTVVEEVINPQTEITLEEARKLNPEINLEELITEPLPPIEFGRVAAQSARQVIMQKVREAERAHQFEEYKDRIGQIVNALVKRIEFGNVIMDLGRAEGILRREESIQRETFRTGDRVRVYILDVRPEARGPMIILSRTHPQFMAKLFEQEVPEIYDGVIEIKAVARDPGSRAKIAVYSSDPSVDPVGACVGMRGSRVQAIVSELQGEKVDIIPWASNPATFVVNALAPAEVARVVIDEDVKRVDVAVSEDQLSLAIGRRGQNVRLASQLTGWNIDIMTEAEEAARRTGEHAARTRLFMDALDVDEMIAQLLASEGFATLEELSEIPFEEFLRLEGFDEGIAKEIQDRARNYLATSNENALIKCREAGMAEDLLVLDGLSSQMLVKLLENQIKTLDDLADLANDELVELMGQQLISVDKANELIMAARSHWFEEETTTEA